MTSLQILTSHLGVAVLVSVIYASWLLRSFSQRIGEVTRMPSYYRWFTLGNVLMFIALLSYTFQCSAALTPEVASSTLILHTKFSLWTFYIPLAIGVGIDTTVTLIYWKWLIHEK